MSYKFYLASLVTGDVVADVQLSSFSGKRHLLGGDMSASMFWANLGQAQRVELQEFTTPGKYTIIAERNGVVAGEWIIWKRSRDLGSGSVSLTGAELVSFVNQRAIPAFTFTNTEQLVIANALAGAGLNAGVGINVVLPVAPVSGVLRDRTYQAVEAKVGDRMRELSQVSDGFDYYIESSWATTPGVRRVVRTMRYFSPRAGQDQPYILAGKNIAALHVDEDGTLLASSVWAVGSGEGPDRVLSNATSSALTDAGYPSMVSFGSWTSVKSQFVLDRHAAALLSVSQSSELPPQLTIAADGDPAFGTYNLGDRMVASIDPAANFPTGYSSWIRVLGWTLTASSGVEYITLDITSSEGGGA